MHACMQKNMLIQLWLQHNCTAESVWKWLNLMPMLLLHNDDVSYPQHAMCKGRKAR